MRKIKTKSGTYLAEVRNKIVDGKVKQEFIRYVGKGVNSSIMRKISSRLGINAMVPEIASVMVYLQLLDRPQ